MFAPGALINGRYRLVRVLASGAMGVVWLATNETIAREVAIKVLLPHVAKDPIALQRFFNEARICGSIRHPGMVDVLDLGQAEDGSPFLVMERLHGVALEEIAARGIRLEPNAILPILRDVARTLALAHASGVVHRDLKPANLFLHRTSAGQVVVKVLDFGISKVSNPALAASTSDRAQAATSGGIVGSPAYMSPEQAGGRVEVDARSDVYSLGVILYEALTGQLPFLEPNYNSLIVHIATCPAPDIQALAPSLPQPIADLVRGALAFDREARIPTCDELARRIDAVLPAAGAIDPASVLALAKSHMPAPSSATPAGRGPAEVSSRVAVSVSTSSRAKPSAPPIWVPISIGVLLALAVAIVIAIVVPFRVGPAPVAVESASVREPAPAAAPSESASASPPPAPSAAAPAPSASASAAPLPRPLRGPIKKKKPGVFSYD